MLPLRYSCQDTAEHFQQCAEFLLLRDRGLAVFEDIAHFACQRLPILCRLKVKQILASDMPGFLILCCILYQCSLFDLVVRACDDYGT